MGGLQAGTSNPMFMGLGQGIRRAMAQQDNEKVDAFVQKVENDARASSRYIQCNRCKDHSLV